MALPFSRALHAALELLLDSAIRLSLTGFCSIFRNTGIFIERSFLVEHYLKPSNAVYFVLDAFPWSFGGVLLCNQVLQEHVTIALSSKDVALLGSGWVIRQDNMYRKASPRLHRSAYEKRMATAEMCLNVRGDPVAMLLW